MDPRSSSTPLKAAGNPRCQPSHPRRRGKSDSYGISMLFDDKRVLCDCVFVSSTSISDSCFTHISSKATNLLFGFPQVLMTVKSKKNSSSSELDNSYSSALHQLVMLLLCANLHLQTYDLVVVLNHGRVSASEIEHLQ
ncbi:hypothetical protein ACFX11_030278 [Malus domestica]